MAAPAQTVRYRLQEVLPEQPIQPKLKPTTSTGAVAASRNKTTKRHSTKLLWQKVPGTLRAIFGDRQSCPVKRVSIAVLFDGAKVKSYYIVEMRPEPCLDFSGTASVHHPWAQPNVLMNKH